MVESAIGRIDFENVPPECVPFQLLLPREKEVLQLTSEGFEPGEIGTILHITPRTVKVHRRNIRAVGYPGPRDKVIKDGSDEFSIIALALIVDGINNGYIQHQLPSEPLDPLTYDEALVMDAILDGKSIKEASYLLKNEVEGSVRKHLSKVREKLKIRNNNNYHLAARATFLRKHKLMAPYYKPEKKMSRHQIKKTRPLEAADLIANMRILILNSGFSIPQKAAG